MPALVLNIPMNLGSNGHVHRETCNHIRKPDSEERDSRGCVCAGEVRSRDSTCVPSLFCTSHPIAPQPPCLPPAHTPSLSLPVSHTVKSTYFCSSVQRSQSWAKKGWENKGWRGESHPKIHVCCCSAHCGFSAELSELTSLTYAHTYKLHCRL